MLDLFTQPLTTIINDVVDMTIPISFFYLALSIGLVLVGVIIYLLMRLNKLEKKKKETELHFQTLENKVDNLQLETLESKLNPHLLKNILNSIQSHAHQTYFALDKLANVLDYILYESRNKFVTPKEEIEFALNLIEINRVRDKNGAREKKTGSLKERLNLGCETKFSN